MKMRMLLQVATSMTLADGAVGLYVNSAQAYEPCPQWSANWSSEIKCTDSFFGKSGSSAGQQPSYVSVVADLPADFVPAGCLCQFDQQVRWQSRGFSTFGVPIGGSCVAQTTGDTVSSPNHSCGTNFGYTEINLAWSACGPC